MPEQNGSYYARSWALLTKDRGWMKPLLVLGAALLLPFIGFLGVQGYALEWARLTAWGVDAAPKQKDVRVGECIASGWRGFLAGVGYALAAALINNLVVTWFGGLGIAGLLSLLVSFVGNMAYTLAALRATIYQDVSAGYAFERIWEMVRRDTDGFLKVAVVMALTSVAVGAATAVLFTVAIVPSLVGFALNVDTGGMELVAGNITEPVVRYIFFEFVDQLVMLAPLLTIISYIGSVAAAFATLINTNAMALWVRQFNVPAWGASSDPLPMAYGLPPVNYVAQQVPYQQAQDPYQQVYQQQETYQQPYQQVQDPYQQPYQQVQDPYQAAATYEQPQVQETYQQPSFDQQVAAYDQQTAYDQQEPIPQEAERQPVQPLELEPIVPAINPQSKTNDVENKVVPSDTASSQPVREDVEQAETTVVDEPIPQDPVVDEPEPMAGPAEAPEPVDEPTQELEESVQSSQQEPQTESDESAAQEEE